MGGKVNSSTSYSPWGGGNACGRILSLCTVYLEWLPMCFESCLSFVGGETCIAIRNTAPGMPILCLCTLGWMTSRRLIKRANELLWCWILWPVERQKHNLSLLVLTYYVWLFVFYLIITLLYLGGARDWTWDLCMQVQLHYLPSPFLLLNEEAPIVGGWGDREKGKFHLQT